MSKIAAVFAAKDRVNNPTFGPGTITQVDEQYTTIVFDEHGTKRFLTPMVRLERTDVPAPERPVRASKSKTPKSPR